MAIPFDAESVPGTEGRKQSILRDTFVLILTAAIVISFIDRYLPSVLVDEIRRDVALNDVQFSTIQTAFAMVYAAATLASGWLADRTDRMRLVAGGVALWTIGAAIFGFANDLGMLLTGRVLIGFGEAALGPAGVSLLCDRLAPEQRGKAIALTYFGATLGTSLAFSGGGWLLAIAHQGAFQGLPLIGAMSGWRQVVLLLAMISGLFLPPFLLFSEPDRRAETRAVSANRFGDFWVRRSLLWPIFGLGLTVAVADFAYTSWQTALLTRTYGISTGTAGQYLGFTALAAGTVGAWIGGIMTDRARRRDGAKGRVALISLCAMGLLGATALLAIPFAWGAIAAFAAWQFVANVAYVACAVTLVELVTDRTRASATAISVSLSIGLGLGFGPTMIASLNQAIGHGHDALVPSTAIVLAVMGLTTLLLSRLLIGRLSTSSPDF